MSKSYNLLGSYRQMSRENGHLFKVECMELFAWSDTTFYRKITTGHVTPIEYREIIKLFNRYLNN